MRANFQTFLEHFVGGIILKLNIQSFLTSYFIFKFSKFCKAPFSEGSFAYNFNISMTYGTFEKHFKILSPCQQHESLECVLGVTLDTLP